MNEFCDMVKDFIIFDDQVLHDNRNFRFKSSLAMALNTTTLNISNYNKIGIQVIQYFSGDQCQTVQIQVS